MSDYTLETEPGRREALRRMLLIREFDTTAGERFNDGDIPGFVHLYIGEEAVGVGTCGALEPEDYVASTHRGHGHCISKGLDPELMMAELYGKADGYCNGKGGSMHIADVEAGMLGANGIVGAGPPLATGAALTIDYQDSDQVALAFGGDGSVAGVNPVLPRSYPNIGHRPSRDCAPVTAGTPVAVAPATAASPASSSRRVGSDSITPTYATGVQNGVLSPTGRRHRWAESTHPCFEPVYARPTCRGCAVCAGRDTLLSAVPVHRPCHSRCRRSRYSLLLWSCSSREQ